ncbi:unnamed protein product, partial [marine sediment metagenome]
VRSYSLFQVFGFTDIDDIAPAVGERWILL